MGRNRMAASSRSLFSSCVALSRFPRFVTTRLLIHESASSVTSKHGTVTHDEELPASFALFLAFSRPADPVHRLRAHGRHPVESESLRDLPGPENPQHEPEPAGMDQRADPR